MKKEEIVARLKEIIIDRLDVEEEQIAPEASFVEDLGADSLDIVELIMGIEEEFDIEIPDEDNVELFCFATDMLLTHIVYFLRDVFDTLVI